jgi:hypothetical protein
LTKSDAALTKSDAALTKSDAALTKSDAALTKSDALSKPMANETKQTTKKPMAIANETEKTTMKNETTNKVKPLLNKIKNKNKNIHHTKSEPNKPMQKTTTPTKKIKPKVQTSHSATFLKMLSKLTMSKSKRARTLQIASRSVTKRKRKKITRPRNARDEFIKNGRSIFAGQRKRLPIHMAMSGTHRAGRTCIPDFERHVKNVKEEKEEKGTDEP